MTSTERLFTKNEAELIARASRRETWEDQKPSLTVVMGWIGNILTRDKRFDKVTRRRLERALEALAAFKNEVEISLNKQLDPEDLLEKETIWQLKDEIETREAKIDVPRKAPGVREARLRPPLL